jgi:hypothetical protein
MDFVLHVLGRNAAVKDAGPSNSPTPARPSDATDEQLSSELKKWTGATPALQPVGELLDRHWEAAFAYARLCTDGARPAGMLTTAAFTRLFGESLRQTGPTSAWRPQLLVTVRRIAAEWDTDHRREMLHPELRSEAGHGERVAARLLPPADRRLLSGAFQRLPQSARCLLWHTEVEAEPIAIPAGLLGLEDADARVELGRARERLREECLQVHRELAPEQECRHYLRLLDVTYRRGGVDLDPDLRGHLDRCRHCRYTADQLGQFNGALGIALAEAVLGWGAQAYLESRAGLGQDTAALPEETPAPMPGENFAPAAPGPRTAARRSTHKCSRRAAARRAAAARRRNLAAAVLTVSGLIVLPLVLWSTMGSPNGNTQGDGGQPSDAPGSGAGTPTSDPSWVGAGDTTQGDLHGRLHNLESGLCVGIVGDKAVKGAETELAKCSSKQSQQWSYESDGLLRSAADPDLCLDSHLGFSVRLAPCAGASKPATKSVRYDFTLQGTLVPRWDQDLALTPAATDGSGALVLKTRGDDAVQRWMFDTSKTELQMEAVNWGADSAPSTTPSPTPKASRTPAPTPTPTPSTPQASPTPTSSYPSGAPCYGYSCSWGGHYGGYGYGGGRH